MKRVPHGGLASLMDVGQLNRNVTSAGTRLTSTQELLSSLAVGGTLDQFVIFPQVRPLKFFMAVQCVS
jgi:hypothetical protein